MKSVTLTDEQGLVGATYGISAFALETYDDGFGKLWIHRDSMGITGIVRAQTWEDAYSIFEDEFFPAADEEASIEIARIEAMPEGKKRNHEEACWDEAYSYRNNSRRESDGTISSIYAKDLNGDSLECLTEELAADLNIVLTIINDDSEEKSSLSFVREDLKA